MSNSTDKSEHVDESKSSSDTPIDDSPVKQEGSKSLEPMNNVTPMIFNNIDQNLGIMTQNNLLRSPMYINPMFYQPNMMHLMNYNDLNQGIFIPQETENNQYFFIPGNIDFQQSGITSNRNSRNLADGFHQNDSGMENDDSFLRKQNDPPPVLKYPKQIYFVPTLDSDDTRTKNGSKDNDNHETYLVPIKIKKEVNGSIELLPESNIQIISQPTNPDQLNILRKIYHLKNQNRTEEPNNFTPIVKINDKYIENCDNVGMINTSYDKNVIDNIQDKTEGFMMVRFNKPSTKETALTEAIKTATNGSLKLSSASSLANRNKIHVNRSKIRKKDKSPTLTISVQLDKNHPAAQNTSRFRRLRIDDKTRSWHINSSSCIDTRLRDIPSAILDLSRSNEINIPPDIFDLFNQQPPIPSDLSVGSIHYCEHSLPREMKLKKDTVEDHIPFFDKRRFWKYMCSMNNCEFAKSRKSII